MIEATERSALRWVLRGGRHAFRLSALFVVMAGCGAPVARAPAVPRGAVVQAHLPYFALAEEKPIDDAALLQLMGEHEALCVGESHDSLQDHYAQWQLAIRFGHLARQRGSDFAVGLEMLDYGQQPHLDHFSRGLIDEAEFLAASGWQTRWGYSFEYYRPILMSSRRLGGNWLALNAPRAWASAVARLGPRALAETPLGADYPLALDSDAHRDFFGRALGMRLAPRPETESPEATTPPGVVSETKAPSAHTHGHLDPEHLYAAQVLWDTFMAQRAALWLENRWLENRWLENRWLENRWLENRWLENRWLEHKPRRKLLILAGKGHCLKSGLPARLNALGHPTLSVGVVLRSELGRATAPTDGEFDLLVVLDDAERRPSVAVKP